MSPSEATTPSLVDTRPKPSAPVVMYQAWKDLLFLHWEVPPADIQRSLPPGLAVDTFGGAAWIGLVPFLMCDVRPRFCPTVPGLSSFLELNVRTYVRDSAGNSGVWFYSLDCNQPIAVAIARGLFHLPYFRARMRAQAGPASEMIYYDCRRDGAASSSHYEYRAMGPTSRAVAGSLEEFLVERYRLFSFRNGTLYSGEVWHEPYTFAGAEVPQWCTKPLRQAGFGHITMPPDHAIFSTGVDVSIFPLRRAGGTL